MTHELRHDKLVWHLLFERSKYMINVAAQDYFPLSYRELYYPFLAI